MLIPVSVSHSTRTIVSLFRDGDVKNMLLYDEASMIEGMVPFKMHFYILLRTLVRKTRCIYRSTPN